MCIVGGHSESGLVGVSNRTFESTGAGHYLVEFARTIVHERTLPGAGHYLEELAGTINHERTLPYMSEPLESGTGQYLIEILNQLRRGDDVECSSRRFQLEIDHCLEALSELHSCDAITKEDVMTVFDKALKLSLPVNPSVLPSTGFISGHPMFEDGKSEFVPTNEQGQVLTWIMAAFPEIPWESDLDVPIGNFFIDGDDSRYGNIVAASATGKSSAVFRALAKRHGIYLVCTQKMEIGTALGSSDHQMGELYETILTLCNNSPTPAQSFRFHAYATNYIHIAIMSRLFMLIRLVENYKETYKKIPPAHVFLSWQMNGNTLVFQEAFSHLLRSHPSLLYYRPGRLADLSLEILAELKGSLGNCALPVFIDKAGVFVRQGCLIGHEVVTVNGSLRKDSLLSLLTDTTLSSICQRESMVTIGTALLPSFISEPTRANIGGHKGFKNLEQSIGEALIQTPGDVIKLLEVCFKIPPLLKMHIESVDFVQYLPLRRRFLAGMISTWITLFDSQFSPSSVTEEDLCKATKDHMEESAADMVLNLGTQILPTSDDNFCQVYALLDFLSYNVEDTFLFQESLIFRGREELRESVLTSGLCAYSRSSAFNSRIKYVTNEHFTRRVVRTISQDHPEQMKSSLLSLLQLAHGTYRQQSESIGDQFFALFLRYCSLKWEAISEWPFFKTAKICKNGKSFKMLKSKAKCEIRGLIVGLHSLSLRLSEVNHRCNDAEKKVLMTLSTFIHEVLQERKKDEPDYSQLIVKSPKGAEETQLLPLDDLSTEMLHQFAEEAGISVFDKKQFLQEKTIRQRLNQYRANRKDCVPLRADDPRILLNLTFGENSLSLNGVIAYLIHHKMEWVIEGFVVTPAKKCHLDGLVFFKLDEEYAFLAYAHKFSNLKNANKNQAGNLKQVSLVNVYRNITDCQQSVFISRDMSAPAEYFRSSLLSYKQNLLIAATLPDKEPEWKLRVDDILLSERDFTDIIEATLQTRDTADD